MASSFDNIEMPVAWTEIAVSDFLSENTENVGIRRRGGASALVVYEASWFEPVSLLSRCSLNEGLLWVWAERVPVSIFIGKRTLLKICRIGNVSG